MRSFIEKEKQRKERKNKRRIEKALKSNKSSLDIRKDLQTITSHSNNKRRTRSNSALRQPPKESREVVIQTLPEMNNQKLQTSD